MYDLAKLCRRIHMPRPVTEQLLSDPKSDPIPGLNALKEHLQQACRCWGDYKKLGLSEEIYIDTMACFSRFVGEHKVSFGSYGFDRDFWTTRQISCQLFRIGMLEYELLEEEGKKYVSIHIPSDARLENTLLRQSWEQAKPLIEATFPDFADVPWICGSWLLSPDLEGLLPPDSRILRFRKAFRIHSSHPSDSFREWVYKREDTPNEDLPEDTTLQRSLKAFLLAGNTFRSGDGVLIEDPFV